jgi:hypothetical protein
MLLLATLATLSLLVSPLCSPWQHAALQPARRVPTLVGCDAGSSGDAALVAATKMLRENPDQARLLLQEARTLYTDSGELNDEKRELLGMVEARIEQAQAQVRKREDEAPGGLDARSLQAKAVATKLAAKLGPVAWTPTAGSKEEEEAMREGDTAVYAAVGALGRKDFEAAYDSLEAARDAFRRAGSDVEEARSQTVENVYGYIRAEMERNVKLQKLVRMKEILKKKKALDLQDAVVERTTKSGSDED